MKQQLFRLIQIPFTLWVLLFAVSGYYFPWLYDWNHGGWEPRQAIVPLVQVIMFGMGVSLSFADFRRVLKMPRAVLIGVICQFSIMPFLAWIFVVLFQLPTEIAAGLILIGSCPGGVTSNVIAYIARANVPLSVTMTACSTMLSPFLTPLLMEFWAGQYVPIPVLPMMRSILFMVLLPVLLGLFVNQFAPRFVNRLGKILPGIAMFSICLIIAITIALAIRLLLWVLQSLVPGVQSPVHSWHPIGNAATNLNWISIYSRTGWKHLYLITPLRIALLPD